MSIPDFLKRENRPPIDKAGEEFDRTLEEYEKLFGEEISNEPSSMSLEQWTEIMKLCIKEKKTYEELTGDVLEKDALY